MKVRTDVLKTKAGKVVATVYPWDSKGNREWQRKNAEKRYGEPLQWQSDREAEVMAATL